MDARGKNLIYGSKIVYIHCNHFFTKTKFNQTLLKVFLDEGVSGLLY